MLARRYVPVTLYASEVPQVLSCVWNRDPSQCEADG